MTPAFDLGFALESSGSRSFLLGIDNTDRLVAPGVGTALAVYVLTKSFFRVISDAGIETPAAAPEYIDKPHWGYYIAKRYQPHTSDSIYEKIGA